MFLKGELNPHPLWSGLVWPESNEKCQALCQLSYRGTCRIMLQKVPGNKILLRSILEQCEDNVAKSNLSLGFE